LRFIFMKKTNSISFFSSHAGLLLQHSNPE
jgi:hypothetical protein